MSAAFAMLKPHPTPIRRKEARAVRVANVIIDVPTRALATHFDYAVPPTWARSTSAQRCWSTSRDAPPWAT